MDTNKLKNLLIPTNTTIKKAMQKLNETSEQILFVVDAQNILLGVVTDGDIRRGFLTGLDFSDNVEKVMCQKFKFLRFDTIDLEKKAKKLMIETKIERIPILNEKGEIVNIITWTDFFRNEKFKKINKYTNKVIIMAGGKGTRLDPFTRILPKPLIPIGNKPVIEIIMERFYQYGFNRFLYTLNYKKEYIKLFLKENNFSHDYNIEWVEEDIFSGTVGSLSLLNGKIDDTFFVVNCDSLLDVDFEDVLKWHKEHRASVTIIGCHNEVKIPFGVLELSDGKLKRILEKPVRDVIINTGVYVMEPHVITYIPENSCMNMNDLLDLVTRKEKITVYPIYGKWLDIGQWEEYNKTIEHLKGC